MSAIGKFVDQMQMIWGSDRGTPLTPLPPGNPVTLVSKQLTVTCVCGYTSREKVGHSW